MGGKRLTCKASQMQAWALTSDSTACAFTAAGFFPRLDAPAAVFGLPLPLWKGLGRMRWTCKRSRFHMRGLHWRLATQKHLPGPFHNVYCAPPGLTFCWGFGMGLGMSSSSSTACHHARASHHTSKAREVALQQNDSHKLVLLDAEMWPGVCVASGGCSQAQGVPPDGFGTDAFFFSAGFRFSPKLLGPLTLAPLTAAFFAGAGEFTSSSSSSSLQQTSRTCS